MDASNFEYDPAMDTYTEGESSAPIFNDEDMEELRGAYDVEIDVSFLHGSKKALVTT